MSAKSTITITREDAIGRIKLIQRLAMDKDYRGIEMLTGEDGNNALENFVNNFNPVDAYINNINKWTNTMLERVMDKPFYRHDRLENYNVED